VACCATAHSPANSVFAVQSRSQAFLTWTPPPVPLVVGRRDPPVLLSLLLSAAVRPGHVGKITLLNILERHPHGLT
jgi:hypothetical protein